MNRKIFSLIISLFFALVTYILFGIWGIFEIKKNENFLFKSKKELEFHKKYSEKMHHLRDVDRWGKIENDFLFSKVFSKNDKNKTILFQGDSWVESISEITKSNKLLRDFAKKNEFNIINAGITSFAPSLMHIQYKILKKDFKISPDIIVIYIDQTDLGDEFCRYRKNKVYSSNGDLVQVKREKYNKVVYDYTKLYEYSDLKLGGSVNIVLKYPYIKSRYFFKRNIYRSKQIFVHGLNNRNVEKCSFKEIRKELLVYNPEAEKNFKKSLNEYLNLLKKDEKIEKLLVVSFPHLNHHKKLYRVNVSDYIDEVLKTQNDKRIEHLNISLTNININNIDKIYKKDYASHLNDEYHTKIFLKKILLNVL